MSFLYQLPDISKRKPSYAIVDGVETTLGRKFAEDLAAHPGKSGVYLLPYGRDAFAARVLLLRKAEKSLDIQYYMYHQDTVGNLLSYEILQAADRGVRVRMLIDDIYGNLGDATWVALDAHPNIEVRLWNPWKRGYNRMIQSLLRARSINFRMHSKSFTVDNQVTILGGRNIGNEYFEADSNVAFSDLDVVTIGPQVSEVSSQFDSYWNNGFSYPVNILVRQGNEQDLDVLRNAKSAFYKEHTTSVYVKALLDSGLVHGLKEGQLAFSWSDARLIHDSALKETLGTGKAGRDASLISQLAPYITGAKKSVDIISPYFVPSDLAVDALCKLAHEGVEVRVLTNSLASNDVMAVHAGYSKYRRKLLRCGVQLFEMDEAIKERRGKELTWLPGLKKSSLHAKTMAFDSEYLFVGSFNFDQRSLKINNEIGLIFREPVLAQAAAKRFEEHVNDVAFKLELSGEGGRKNIRWVGGQGGTNQVMKEEPYATTFEKLTASVLKWLPINSQL